MGRGESESGMHRNSEVRVSHLNQTKVNLVTNIRSALNRSAQFAERSCNLRQRRAEIEG